MITLIRLYFNMLAAGALLLASLMYVSPAQADFGISGIEVSPVRSYASASVVDYATFSGTINFELPNPNTELSIPFLWSQFDDSSVNDGFEALTIDLQWRSFDTARRNGGYVGLLARAVGGSTSRFGEANESDLNVGLGVVAGFRRSISGGFYWGTNMSMVAFGDEPENLDIGEHKLFQQKLSITFDFLKIGYQF